MNNLIRNILRMILNERYSYCKNCGSILELQEGFDENGQVIGYHTPTGNIPHFVEELKNSGDLRLSMSVFVPRV